eukprot:Rmarinus@m.30140
MGDLQQGLSALKSALGKDKNAVKKAAMDLVYFRMPKSALPTILTLVSYEDKKASRMGYHFLHQLSDAFSDSVEDIQALESIMRAIRPDLQSSKLGRKIMALRTLGMFCRTTDDITSISVQVLKSLPDPNAEKKTRRRTTLFGKAAASVDDCLVHTACLAGLACAYRRHSTARFGLELDEYLLRGARNPFGPLARQAIAMLRIKSRWDPAGAASVLQQHLPVLDNPSPVNIEDPLAGVEMAHLCAILSRINVVPMQARCISFKQLEALLQAPSSVVVCEAVKQLLSFPWPTLTTGDVALLDSEHSDAAAAAASAMVSSGRLSARGPLGSLSQAVLALLNSKDESILNFAARAATKLARLYRSHVAESRKSGSGDDGCDLNDGGGDENCVDGSSEGATPQQAVPSYFLPILAHLSAVLGPEASRATRLEGLKARVWMTDARSAAMETLNAEYAAQLTNSAVDPLTSQHTQELSVCVCERIACSPGFALSGVHLTARLIESTTDIIHMGSLFTVWKCVVQHGDCNAVSQLLKMFLRILDMFNATVEVIRRIHHCILWFMGEHAAALASLREEDLPLAQPNLIPVMTMIVMRLQQATCTEPWEIRCSCVRGLGKVAIRVGGPYRRIVMDFLAQVAAIPALCVEGVVSPIMELLADVNLCRSKLLMSLQLGNHSDIRDAVESCHKHVMRHAGHICALPDEFSPLGAEFKAILNHQSHSASGSDCHAAPSPPHLSPEATCPPEPRNSMSPEIPSEILGSIHSPENDIAVISSMNNAPISPTNEPVTSPVEDATDPSLGPSAVFGSKGNEAPANSSPDVHGTPAEDVTEPVNDSESLSSIDEE